MSTTSALRKGTRSCAECRRRKVRCVRLSQDAGSCRQCEDRGVSCTGQAPRSSRTPRFSSRRRIAQLESQIAQLTGAVHNIESKLGCTPSEIIGRSSSPPVECDFSEHDSDASDIPMANNPAHLRALFDNDWLSVEVQGSKDIGEKTCDQLALRARPKLQALIPSKPNVAYIAGSAYDWLHVLQAMFPQPLMVRSQDELLERYDHMVKPDVDPIDLASWLLILALTAQQIPQDESFMNRVLFSRRVMDTVESTLMCHDRLLGTVEGLGMAIHLLRLLIGQGNLQKAWTKMRHVTAIAELMALPKVCGTIQRHQTDVPDESYVHKFQLWNVLCNVDRLLGMLMNLPPGTSQYPIQITLPLVVDGGVQLPVYITHLMTITLKFQVVDKLNIAPNRPELKTELKAACIVIVQDLEKLASQVPNEWWSYTTTDNFKPKDLVQFIHYSICMRAYLPFALKPDFRDGAIQDTATCMRTCTSVARRYLMLRRTIPPGLFVARVLDIQAFTAAAILFLLSHCAFPECHAFMIDRKEHHSVAKDVMELMRKTPDDASTTHLAADAYYKTLYSMNQLLQQERHSRKDDELDVTVPLLGRIHIRRKAWRPAQTTAQPSEPLLGSSIKSLQDVPVYGSEMPMGVDVLAQSTWGTVMDDLSWSIESPFDYATDDVLCAMGFGGI
ncbi:hypothetical protein BDV25DRAFT_104898 [Aspergillus avenaceus]|uniref:Zn(2)-C6 fungal-type domain-containing protein n=1 Tax=Aspergillus avenaceus TaxID=36643 RepID=A0A5N6TXL8_ASPAV|nr:hypothetical protein BDV25DRAFT_104898 [Aspergillus avenaceus]